MFKGSMVAVVTPMNEAGDYDARAFARLLQWHLDAGTDGVVAVGTTGESATLSPDEHLQVIEDAVRVIAGRVPVIAGSGSNNTHDAMRMTREAAALGADASLQVVPYYNRPNQEGPVSALCHHRRGDRYSLPSLQCSQAHRV